MRRTGGTQNVPQAGSVTETQRRGKTPNHTGADLAVNL